MAVSKKKIIKNAALAKVIDSSLTNLEAATANGAKALALATKNSKQSAAEGKRLSKKRVTLIKRRKTASAKVQKDPIAANKKALSAVDKELAAIRKAAAKNKIVKAANFEELSGLRVSCRRLSAYNKAITAADKVLNKPKKKTRRRKAA
mgnify:CR=1 FL=1|tara:strand:+ start:1763 stop:2209 length:447 start_codon:yes stop_codon:yes gene_type:complete